jgi:hypothetical protein
MASMPTPSAEPRPFTPVHRVTGERLELLVERQELPRGRKWTRVMTDLTTGRKYRAWQKSCGLPGCLCDAYVIEL